MDIPFLTDVHLIVWLQSNAWLDAPMRLFTFLGSEPFFMFVLPVIYWCIDAGLGIRIGLILLCSDAVNGVAKLALHSPRPYWVSMEVRALAAESSFGAPSGHAQNAAMIWGTVAASSRRRVVGVVAGALIFLIGISRLYLAVHFPLDVLLGWLLGSILLWGILALWLRLSTWVTQRSLIEQVLLGLVVPAVLILCSGLLASALSGFKIPLEWLSNASRAGEPLPAPLSIDGVLTDTGAMFGLALGLIWIAHRGGFQPSGPLIKRIACFAVGLSGVAVLYFGLKLLLPAEGALLGAGMRFLRYAVLGVWISGGAPRVFASLNLTERYKKPLEPLKQLA